MTEGELPPGTRPLRELDQIQWRTLRHAYGSARNVPRLVRRLAKGRADAEHDLFCSILHQGQIYSATGPALPFVFGVMAATPALHDDLAQWCGDLAWVFEDSACDERDVEQRATVRAVRAALVAVLPTVARLLDHEDAEIRSNIAGFLGQVGSSAEARATAAAALHRRWPEETDPVMRADLVRSLGALGPSRADLDALAATWPSDGGGIRDLAFAHARFLSDSGDTGAVDILLRRLAHGDDRGTGWWRVDAVRSILETLMSSSDWSQRAALRDAVEAAVLGQLARHSISAPASLAALVEAHLPAAPPDLAAQLAPRARGLIEKLAAVPEYWVSADGQTIYGSACLVLHHKQLPCSAPNLRRWLDGAPRAECVGYPP